MTTTGDAKRTGFGSDLQARRRIAEELDRCFLVEAGAGSGKTTSLVERMAALVASGRAGIEDVAAVTFTRKAAAEMRGRFQLKLEKMLADVRTAPEARARIGRALGGFEQCFIGTVHSFCSLLIRERPVEAGIDPDFEELDEADDAFFREKCWHEFLDEVRIGRPDILERLDAAGLSALDLKDAFELMSGYPEAEPVPGADMPPDVGGLADGLAAFRAEICALMPQQRPDKGFDDLQNLVRRLGWRLKHLDHQDIRVLMASLAICDKDAGVTKNRWPSREDADTALAGFESFREDLVIPALRSWREFRHQAALALLRPALEHYGERRRRYSKLNFCDLLLVASGMLADNPEVRAFFRKRFKCILVDEFQDTDPIQAEMLFYLTGSETEEKDWTKLVPEPGSLFLVGDPKQSIYRFRRADIDIYNLVKERLLAGGGEVLELTANFRTLRPIADRLNTVFGDPAVFPEKADCRQAGFAPLLAGREDPGLPAGYPGRIARITVPKIRYHNAEAIAAYDAVRTAGFIAWALRTGLKVTDGKGSPRTVEAADFLVLFRYKANMGLYAAELEKRNVPYEVFGSEAFASREEIVELRKVLAFLASPADPVLAVSVLRGMFFGASDRDLLAFREAGGDFSLLTSGPVPEEAPLIIRQGMEILRRWVSWTGTEPASVVLARLVADSGLLVHLVPAERGGTRAGNVLKLIEILRGLETRGITRFRDAAEYLEERLETGSTGEMGLVPGGAGAVRLMNLHKAKGLEAPVVILANPKGKREHAASSHIARLRGDEGGAAAASRPPGYFLLTRRNGFSDQILSQPCGWEDKAVEEKLYMEAEEKRLMYVAATRARDLLVISSYEEDLGAQKAWGVLDDSLCRVEGPSAVPELVFDADAGAEEGPSAKVPPIDPAEIAVRAVELNRKKGQALRAGCRVETVTGLARHEGPGPDRQAGDYGMKWGSAVHILLNGIGRSSRAGAFDEGALAALAGNALTAVDMDGGRAEELVAYIKAILDSGFWKRAMGSIRAFFEVPFAISIGREDPDYRELAGRQGFFKAAGGEALDTAADAPFLLNGVMDLVFLEKDGWVVADYKSDRLDDPTGRRTRDEVLRERVEFYAPQVKLYSRYWERITGETVGETGLYFVSSREWVTVPTRSPAGKRRRS